MCGLYWPVSIEAVRVEMGCRVGLAHVRVPVQGSMRARCPMCALFVPNGYRRDVGSLLSVLPRRRLTHRMAVNNQMGR